MNWWRKAKFGMFIHFGLYSLPGGLWKGKKIPGYSEWMMYWGRIPKSEYKEIAENFNPVKFDAKKIVTLAKKAGMKYLIITAKHHDGFCLFNSEFTDFDVKATPFKRDIIQELSEACRKEKIKFGVYYSILDWDKSSRVSMFARYEDFYSYLKYMRSQIKELLTNYKYISVLFFDGDWIPQWNKHRGRDLEEYCRSCKPGIIINDRVGKRPLWNLPHMPSFLFRSNNSGDYDTPEQAIPSGRLKRDWEVNMTMNNSFGYKSTDNNWKSAGELADTLKIVNDRGGNFLLNIGLTGKGEIPKPSIVILTEIGRLRKELLHQQSPQDHAA
jgi:alpha-L-fucosidase